MEFQGYADHPNSTSGGPLIACRKKKGKCGVLQIHPKINCKMPYFQRIKNHLDWTAFGHPKPLLKLNYPDCCLGPVLTQFWDPNINPTEQPGILNFGSLFELTFMVEKETRVKHPGRRPKGDKLLKVLFG